MKLLRGIFVFFFILLSGTLSAQFYTVQKYNHRDGIVTERTLCTFQDTKGYLWIGTDGDGVMRFDGFHFVSPIKSNTPLNLHVIDGFTSKSGRVFMATSFQGIYTLKGNKYVPFYKQFISIGEPLRLMQVKNNIVFFGTNGIQIISPNGIPLRHKNFSTRLRTEIRQILHTPYGIIAFTSSGNFFITEVKISRLSTYLDTKNGKSAPYFGSFSKNKLVVYDKSGTFRTEIILSNEGDILRKKVVQTKYNFKAIGNLDLVTSNQHTLLLKFNLGDLYTLNDQFQLSEIHTNSQQNLSDVKAIFVDKNKDFWINNGNGLLKLSSETFTKINTNTIFQQPSISKVFSSKNNLFLLSTYNGETYIGKTIYSNTFSLHAIKTNSIIETPLGTLAGTDKGLNIVDELGLHPINLGPLSRDFIQFVHYDGENIWYAPKGLGIIKYNLKTKQSRHYQKEYISFPDHFYNAQNGTFNNSIYFGTNNGVHEYNRETNEFYQHKEFMKIGAFCGSSETDSYGTMWFTLDRGLVGITNKGKKVYIDDQRLLVSNLFYTLCSDNYGNLIIGTNKGIQYINVDTTGKILNSKTFNTTNGFEGYETNLRACFKIKSNIYVGTIEGLFAINTELIEHFPLPQKPLIFKGRESQDGKPQIYNDKQVYTYKTILAKGGNILYSHRLLGYSNKWSKPSPTNELYVSSLSNGKYTLEVKATYDGLNFSEVSALPVVISTPIWQTKWFIVFFVVLLGIINIIYLEWSKSHLKSSVFDSTDLAVDITIIPKIILFGAIVNTTMLIIVEVVEPFAFSLNAWNTTFSFILFACYFVSRRINKKYGKKKLILGLFYAAFAAIMVQYYIIIYLSNVHPFPIIAITIITSVLPYTFTKLRIVIFISLFQLCLGVVLLVFLEETIYDETLFISAIAVSGGLAIMITYLRNDSLEKLIFISGIVNQGNVLAIAFDQKGLITYSSSNISKFFHTTSAFVKGKTLSILNPFVVSSELRSISLVDEFADGKIFLIPMHNKKHEVAWIEWSCKYFNDSVRVIMGQDVTDKLTISTNYQSLVENAQDMIYNTDVNGHFIFLNERATQMFGYRQDNLIGQVALNLVRNDYRKIVHDFYINQFVNKIHHTYLEFPIRSKNGNVFWVGQNVTMMHEPGSRKRISGFIALARDITEKRNNDLLIEQQNKDITSSINSAKRIQFNLLPKATELALYFEQYFVLYRPKDIVSGDFYWIEPIEDKLIVVLADCTGHGVPGAFMTILGINLLNQIVRERKIYEPDVILNQLNLELEKTLPKNENGSYWDGMDLIVTVFDNTSVSFASSGVGLVHFTDDKFNLYRSSLVSNFENRHKKKSILLKENDQVYLFTDGMQKQFGSIRNKKFGFKRILEILEQVHPESLSLQRKYFENALNNWSIGHEQTDDISIIGLKNFRSLEKKSTD